MPTVREYEDAMMAVSDAITDGEYKNKREIKHLVALAHQAVVKKRNEFQQAIADRWKLRFKEIKEENDSRQLEEYRTYKSMINDAWAKENAAIAAAKAAG